VNARRRPCGVTGSRKNVRFVNRIRRWAARVIGKMDMIANLEVAASIGSRTAMRRLRRLEDDGSLDGIVRTAAQAARHRARNVATTCGMRAEDADDAD